MEYTRNCPICSKSMPYKSKNSYWNATLANTSCKSCSIKKLYEEDPDKNKGDKNGRTGKKLIDVFIERDGEQAGKENFESWKNNVAKHGFKKGKDNVSYGKVQNNQGRSYKGWYKDLFFRSSLELLFIMNFEKKNNRLPLSAEGRFRIKYDNDQKTYTPDFYDPNTGTIYEIKPVHFMKDNNDKFEAAKMFVGEQKLNYSIVTDEELGYSDSFIISLLDRLQKEAIIKLTDISIKKLDQRLEKQIARKAKK